MCTNPFVRVLEMLCFPTILLWFSFACLHKWDSVQTFLCPASAFVYRLLRKGNPSDISRPELRGTVTHHSRCVRWYRDFISPVILNRIWGSHSPPLVVCSVFHQLYRIKINMFQIIPVHHAPICLLFFCDTLSTWQWNIYSLHIYKTWRFGQGLGQILGI